MTRFFILLALVCAVCPGMPTLAEENATKTGVNEERPFYMGFQDFSYDKTDQGASDTYAFLRDNADIVCLQFGEDCPWQEAYEGKPWPQALLDKMKRRKDGVGPNKRIYLEISPLDMGRAAMGGTISDGFKGKAFDDPMVKKAYLAYAVGMLDYFEPAFLCIGIEVNELAGNSPDSWPGYVELHKYAYAALKKDHPDLPIFASITLHNMLAVKGKGDQKRLDDLKDFLQFNDAAGISYYPFLGDRPEPPNSTKGFDWIHEFVGAKPIAITETAYPAETIESSSQSIPSSPQDQVDYLQNVFNLAERGQYLFVINFAYRDYDQWWEKDKDKWPEWVKAWKDTGVMDGEGKPRPSYDLWRRYLTRKHVGAPRAGSAVPAGTRCFRMGFQDVAWDDTEEAVAGTYAFLKKNADIVCLQTNGGIPWQAASEGKYSERTQEQWKRRKAGVGDTPVYLEIGPLNSGRTGIGGHGRDFAGKPFDDPLVKQAYLNFLRREIETYRPQYLGVGIEVNELYDNTPELWEGYVNLHKYIYEAIKKDYPKLPIAATMTLHRLLSVKQKNDQKQLDAMKEFLTYSDFAGISFYPFVGQFHDFNDPLKQFDWLKEFVGGKPIAITEIAYPAEPISWGGQIRYPANPEVQSRFVKTLLEVAERDDYLFVIYWAHRDWDARWERVKGSMDEMWTAWRDIGILDGEGHNRPAFDEWRRYFSTTYAVESPSPANTAVK